MMEVLSKNMKLLSIILLLFFLTGCSVFQGPTPSNEESSGSTSYDYKIFFTRVISTSPLEIDILRIDSDGSNEVTLNSTVAANRFPAVSDDGSKIAFIRDSYDLYVMDLDGSNETLIYTSSYPMYNPVFTADGSQIYFSVYASSLYQIYKINSDGSGVATNVSGGTSYNDQQVRFSPDGSKMVFASDRDGVNYEIYIMNADGSGTATQLTSTATGITNQYPSFSPDSSTVVFDRYDGSTSEIYTVPASGGTETQVTSFGYYNTYAQYSPDGTKIIYTRSVGSAQIFYVNLSGTTETQISSNASLQYGTPFVSKAVY